MPGFGRTRPAHFTQPDTSVPGAGDSLAWDRYAYVNYNPMKYTDPTGHFPWMVVGAAIGAIVGGATYALTNQGENFDWGEFALATGVGALAGTAISVGLVGAASAAVATTSSLIGGGTAAIVASESYMIENQNEFEPDEFILNAGINAATGAITGNTENTWWVTIPAEVFGSVGSMVVTTDNPSDADFFIAGISGLVAGGIDARIGKFYDNNFIPSSESYWINQFPSNSIWPEGRVTTNILRKQFANSQVYLGLYSGTITGLAGSGISKIKEYLEIQ